MQKSHSKRCPCTDATVVLTLVWPSFVCVCVPISWSHLLGHQLTLQHSSISMTSIKRPIITGTGHPGRGFARTKLKMITSFWHPWKASTEETCTSITTEKMLAQKLNKWHILEEKRRDWQNENKNQEISDIKRQSGRHGRFSWVKLGIAVVFVCRILSFGIPMTHATLRFGWLRAEDPAASLACAGSALDRKRRTKTENLEKSQKKEGRNKLRNTF